MNALLLAEGLLTDLGINLKVLAVQVFIFVVTFAVLGRLLFGRVLGFMQAREEEIERARQKIEADRAERDRLAREHEAHLARIEREAYDRLQGILREAVAERGRMVAEAQRRASEELKTALAGLAEEKHKSMESLRTEAIALAREAVERVLGGAVEGPALEQAVRASFDHPPPGNPR